MTVYEIGLLCIFLIFLVAGWCLKGALISQAKKYVNYS